MRKLQQKSHKWRMPLRNITSHSRVLPFYYYLNIHDWSLHFLTSVFKPGPDHWSSAEETQRALNSIPIFFWATRMCKIWEREKFDGVYRNENDIVSAWKEKSTWTHIPLKWKENCQSTILLVVQSKDIQVR